MGILSGSKRACADKSRPPSRILSLSARGAYTTIGVEPTVSMDEVTSVYHAKVKYAHPDGVQDPEEKRIR